MLKAKMTLSGLSLPDDKIKSERDDHRMKTTFELRAKLKVSKRKARNLSGEGIDSLNLEWIETCDWFEFTDNKWTFKCTKPDNIDVYPLKASSHTFQNWNKMRYFFASTDALDNAPPPGLKDAVDKAGNMTEERDKAAKHWIAQNGFEWTLPVATDEPGIGLNPSARSGGGAGASSVTTNTRRRVLYLNLGFKGSLPRVTATQILESVNGRPTLHKFLVPAVTSAEANDETKLEMWRQELR